MLRVSITAYLLTAVLCCEARAGKLYQFMSRGRRYQITTDVDRKLAKQIANHMDRVYAEYDRRLSDFHARDSRAMPLYILSTRKGYMKIMRENFGINASNTSGMFFVNERGPMLSAWVQGQSRARLFETLRHEGFHQFADSVIGGDMPALFTAMPRTSAPSSMVRTKLIPIGSKTSIFVPAGLPPG